jgi:hypothetical protein
MAYKDGAREYYVRGEACERMPPPVPRRDEKPVENATKRNATRPPKGKKKKESIFTDETPAKAPKAESKAPHQIYIENTIVPVEDQCFEDVDNPARKDQTFSYSEIRLQGRNAARIW